MNANTMIYPPPKKIVWLYNNDQALYKTLPGVEFHKGMDKLEQLKTGHEHTLLILDDLMTEAKEARELFTRYSHHANLSVIFITQNLFYKGQGYRDMTLSASYIVVFRNPRDKSQIRFLSTQMYPDKPSTLTKAYRKATSKPYSYLFLDLTQEMPDMYRVRTNIFPDQEMTVYCED